MRLIVTRPEPDARRTARALEALGHVPILSPMLQIELARDLEIPRRSYQAVLVSSANAVRALAAHSERARLSSLRLLAVGDSTALEAKRAGFAAARSAGGALTDLASLAAAEFRPNAGPLLYAAGEQRAGDLAATLAARGFEVDTAIAYRARAEKRLSRAASEALKAGAVDGVLLYSGRSAAAFAAALAAEGLAPLAAPIICFCISAAVAEAVASVAGGGGVRIANRPDQLGLFALFEQTGQGPERRLH